MRVDNPEQFGDANEEFISILRNKPFDVVTAKRISVDIKNIDELVLDPKGYETTYFEEAVSYSDYEAVKFLLEREQI